MLFANPFMFGVPMDVLLAEQYRFIDGLSNLMSISLFDYTQEGVFSDINRKLNAEDFAALTPMELRIIKDLDWIFENIPPLETEIILYRGYTYPKFNFRGYTSTSLDITTATGFAFGGDKKCCLFVITAKPGTRVIPLDRVSEFSAEKEVLLGRDTKFTRAQKRTIEGLTSFVMSTLPNEYSPTILDITLSDDMVADTTKDWVARIMELFKEWPTAKDLEGESSEKYMEEKIRYLMSHRWREEAPEEAIQIALRKIKKKK